MSVRRAVLAGLVVAAAVPAPAAAASRPAKLVRFSSCAELTGYAERRVVTTGGETGVPFRAGVLTPATLRPPAMVVTRETVQPALPQATTTTGDAGAGAESEFSSTNVQEAGVDEPDLVKTDGKTLYVVAERVLRVYDVTGPAPRPLARLELQGFEHQLLLRGPRLLVLAAQGQPMPVLDAPSTTSLLADKVVLSEIDVSTPSAPKVARTMELAGRFAGARLTGGTARVVVASSPESIAAPDATRADLAETAERLPLRHWLPRTTIRSRISRRTFRRSVVPCDHVRRPRVFSGLDLLSVLTVDLDRGLYDVARDAVMAGAQDLYASGSSLVVASRRYDPDAETGVDPTGGRTELHLFDAGPEPRTAYRGSGSVPGFILNSFSMSEHEGALRVATTEEAPFDPQAGAGETESGVSVLKLDGGRLVTVGRVTGLGKGERIYAVRFLGERGYVVTFRQVDPLYTLDLRDASAPRVTGELKVTGYSAYLHPISETLLLGVGQDASEQGRRLGPQVSLFDVGDPAKPRLVARAALGGSGQSAAEQDHHAFLWWAPASLAVLPLDTYEVAQDGTDRSFSGAVGFRVGTGGISEVGRITHPKPSEDRMPPPIGRSVVIGDRLLTLSWNGIATNRLADLAPLAFTKLE